MALRDLGHRLAATDAALPPSPARRLGAADLDRALRRSNARRAAAGLAAVAAFGLAWLQLRAAAPDREPSPPATLDLAAATDALRSRMRASFAIAATIRTLETLDPAAAARQRALLDRIDPDFADLSKQDHR